MTTTPSTVHRKAPPIPPILPPMGLCGRWLLVGLFEKKSNDFIRAVMTADSLPCPGDREVDAIRAGCVPKKYKLALPKNGPLLERLGIEQFVGDETPDAKLALALLRNANARALAEAGIVVGVPAKALAQWLYKYTKCVMPTAALDLYRTVFFDTSAMTRAQLKVAVHERVRLGVMRMVADPEDTTAARRAIESDARIVALSLPSSTLSWASVLMSLGFPPGRHELANDIHEMESIGVVRAAESILRGLPGDEQRAQAFVSILSDLRDLRERVCPPSVELAQQLQAFTLRTSDKPMITAAQLCGDRRTVDMGPPPSHSDEE